MSTGAAMEIQIPSKSMYPWKIFKDTEVIETEKNTIIKVIKITVVFTPNRVNSLVRKSDWRRALRFIGGNIVERRECL